MQKLVALFLLAVSVVGVFTVVIVPVAKAQTSVTEPITPEDVTEFKKKYEDLKKNHIAHDKLGIRLAIIGILAVFLRIGMQVLKRIIPFSKKGKKALPVIALVMGMVSFALAKFSGGESWMVSAMWGLTGPGSVFCHELMNLLPKAEEPKKEEVVKVGA
jgi:hypothetical protein